MPDGGARECWGFFGAFQQLSVLLTEDKKRILTICPPTGSTRIQYIKVFLRFSSQHPEFAHLSFAEVALSALEDAFPCKSN